METAITIREEQPHDIPLISDVVLRAYANVDYSDHREHLMIERLRGTDAYNPALSLLAEIDHVTVGHILLTKAHINNATSSVVTLALAPLSVAPKYQSCGVGARLMGAARRQAAALGFESIVVVGVPAYYPRFGYELLSRYPITLPFEAPDANCLILRLTDRALDGVVGMVQYAEGWLDH